MRLYLLSLLLICACAGVSCTCCEVVSENCDDTYTLTGASFTDPRDNTVYRTVKIGDQTWMAENLNYDVPGVTTGVCYENVSDNCTKYGRLYDWETVMNGAPSSDRSPSGVQGICPVGWHVPSDAEWTALNDFVGVGGNVGTRLKSKCGWKALASGCSGCGTDDFGFSALPGGSRSDDGRFFDVGSEGNWWSATEYDTYWWSDTKYLSTSAMGRAMYYDDTYMGWCNLGKSGSFSLRCLQD